MQSPEGYEPSQHPSANSHYFEYVKHYPLHLPEGLIPPSAFTSATHLLDMHPPFPLRASTDIVMRADSDTSKMPKFTVATSDSVESESHSLLMAINLMARQRTRAVPLTSPSIEKRVEHAARVSSADMSDVVSVCRSSSSSATPLHSETTLLPTSSHNTSSSALHVSSSSATPSISETALVPTSSHNTSSSALPASFASLDTNLEVLNPDHNPPTRKFNFFGRLLTLKSSSLPLTSVMCAPSNHRNRNSKRAMRRERNTQVSVCDELVCDEPNSVDKVDAGSLQ